MQTGLIAGLLSALISMIISVWTMYILAALFLERKRELVGLASRLLEIASVSMA